jgi:hypothetical protein
MIQNDRCNKNPIADHFAPLIAVQNQFLDPLTSLICPPTSDALLLLNTCQCKLISLFQCLHMYTAYASLPFA